MEPKITVTSPLLPPLEDFYESLKQIWADRWLTNNGHFLNELEDALCKYLKVPYISVFTNGTIPLLTALQALEVTDGEVITTPYSFIATTHAIWWNGLKPVFVDIDPNTCNIDASLIEAAITPQTKAIMPVHVYGNPCEVAKIQAIADKYHLKVLYDAAHAFGVEKDGISILTYGDISTLSFHATKAFNTIEGGAIVMKDAEMKKKIDYLRNFGIANETEVVGPGINGKMDEVRAAYGLLELKVVDQALERRNAIANHYREAFKSVKGLDLLPVQDNVRPNNAYFPIFIDADTYGCTRDELYNRMKEHNVYGRRYFYPLISNFALYQNIPSATPKNLPVANRIADSVICLPIYPDLSDEDVQRVINEIVK